MKKIIDRSQLFTEMVKKDLYYDITGIAKKYGKNITNFKNSNLLKDFLSDIEYFNTDNNVLPILNHKKYSYTYSTLIHHLLLDFFINWCEKPSNNTLNQHIYLISDGEYCKIGMTSNVSKRIKTLQIGNPHKLKLIFSILLRNETQNIESKIHDTFKFAKQQGEWFKLHKSNIDSIIEFLLLNNTINTGSFQSIAEIIKETKAQIFTSILSKIVINLLNKSKSYEVNNGIISIVDNDVILYHKDTIIQIMRDYDVDFIEDSQLSMNFE